MSPDRRTFIRSAGVAGIAGLAGCPGGGGGGTDTPADDDDATPTDTPADTPTATDTPADTATDTPADTPTDTATATDTPEDTPVGTPAADVPTIIRMQAGGADIWNQTDLGHFYYAEVSGDFDVVVQVTSLANTNPHAKAGIMVRPSMNPSARNILMRLRAGFGISPQWRPQNGTSTTSTTSEAGAPLARVEGGYMTDANWMRLERSGDTFRCYGSSNGEDWRLIVELTPDQIELPDTVLVGLAATSHNNAEATTAVFQNYDGPALQTSEDLGAPIIPGGVSVIQPAVVSDIQAADATPESLTVQGNLTNMAGSDSVDVSYEYREVTADEWNSADTVTREETGTFTVEISGLTPRRYYQVRATTGSGESAFTTVPALLSTPSGSSGSSETGPDSAALHDPGDGYSDFAPWLDDDTPIVVVDEPTRDALASAVNVPGPRVVVFETSGTIDLEAQNLNLRNDQCFIAGQTAPSPGITLIRGGLWVYGNDCVVQHIRVRPGTAGQDRGWQPDAIEIADDTSGNIVDHCTGTWSVDENINVGYDTNNSTLSNCIMAEPLNNATHPKGEHGYNSIIGDRAKNVCWFGNVSALGTDRNPRLKQGTQVAIANNYVHHYHDGMWADPETSHTIIGNVFEDPQTDQPNIFGEGSVFATDNVQRDDAGNPMIGGNITQLDSQPHFPEDLSPVSSSEVRAANLANAGARPADRTPTDERIVEAIRNGDGGVIDHQNDVGGYPELEENTEPVDPPTSGLRAWLREQALAVEQ